MSVRHIISVSGGKDSTATLLLAMERQIDFIPVFADTGNENSLTLDHLAHLENYIGKPIIRVKQDFTDKLAAKKVFIEENWGKDRFYKNGEIRYKALSPFVMERAKSCLEPTGIPFLDLAIWKGRFPSRRGQFCTEWLKTNPIFEQVLEPALVANNVILWTGERHDESQTRANLPTWSTSKPTKSQKSLKRFRPLLAWTVENVFAMHKRHGIQPNPLYLMGMGRVGCFPCINSSKKDLAAIGARFPQVIKRLEEWEHTASLASKQGLATFFHTNTTPQGKNSQTPQNASKVFEWARTSRGGKQFDLISDLENTATCSSQWGYCE